MKLKGVEKCIENNAVECKKGNGAELAKFVKSLHKKIDIMMIKKDMPSRHSMTCS